MSNGIDPNETPRSSPSATLSPTWRTPKTPLTPHRLAKLANALGISTPIPAGLNHPSSTTSFLSRSFSDSAGPPEHLRRSPTPSIASSMGFSSSAPAASKYLLHIIPPMHLPHDSYDSNDSDMTPPPSTASGYHTQFRRGTLVPVHPTLQAQLGAIAKEYALPSTAGLILYLISSGPSAKPSGLDDELEEPGPRLSDDIWRHLWARVVQVEQRDGNLLPPSRSPTPLTLNTGTPSTPFLSQELKNHLRPPNSPSPISPHSGYHLGPSPSPPSSISDVRSNSKFTPPPEPYTPASSINSRTESLDLPGLFSPSLIPILAKVEFDIDRRKAGWYEPWLRSRRANHAKRTRSSSAAGQIVENTGEAKDRLPAIPLVIGRKETVGLLPADPSKNLGAEGDHEEEDAQVAGYIPLSDTQEGDSDLDDDEDELDFAEDSTARVSSIVERKDPLEHIFGSDADTLSDMKGGRRSTDGIKPDVIDLAPHAGDLTTSSYNTEHDFTTREEVEVRELLDRMSQSGKSTPDIFSALSPQSKKVPSPLVLIPNSGPNNVIAAEPSPMPTGATAGLAYLNDDDTLEEFSGLGLKDDEYEYRSRSPAESEKRSGALFEDLDLGLDPSDDYDDDDPNDRRRSQIVMRAQLDEIERTLAQLSPRFMNTDLEEDVNQSFHSISTVSPNSPAKLTLSPLRNFDLISQSRLPKHPDSPGESSADASWPAVPFSQTKGNSSTGGSGTNQSPSPPQLALNGVTTDAPHSFSPRATDEVSSETTQRRKELEEEQAFFLKPSAAAPVIPLSPDPFGHFSSSTPEAPPIISEPDKWDTITVGRDSVTIGHGGKPQTGRARAGTTASRFSVDSMLEEEAPVAAPSTKPNRGTLISVKSIKNLWRKSNKSDRDKTEKGQLAPSSERVSPGVPQRPERPSQETLDLPDLPPMPSSASFERVSPEPMTGGSDMPRRPSQENGNPPRAPSSQGNRPSVDYMGMPQQRRPSQEFAAPRRSQDAGPGLSVPPYANSNGRGYSPIMPAQMLSSRPGSNLDRLRFDQESPYPNPVRNPPATRYAQRMPSPTQPSPPPLQQNSQFSLPSIPEQERLARKSILKWKLGSLNGNQPPQQQDPPVQRTSFDRASNSSSRTNGSGSYAHSINGRKASVHSFSSDLAPLPSSMVPDLYTTAQGGNGAAPRAPSSASSHEYGAKSPLTPFESGSPPPVHYHRPLGARSVSPAASFASSHASIDESQFEIVSPKLHSGFSYPSLHYSGQHIDS